MTAQKEKNNPANGKLELPKGYRPMSGGRLKLTVPEKEGYHRHWFRGTPSRLKEAQRAGYRFVDPDDVDLEDFDIAGGDENTGTDLGSRVSVTSGDTDEKGQAGRLYLMECPKEIFEYAQSILQEQVDATAEALKGGLVGARQGGETGSDVSKRYLKEGMGTSLFNRKQP